MVQGVEADNAANVVKALNLYTRGLEYLLLDLLDLLVLISC